MQLSVRIKIVFGLRVVRVSSGDGSLGGGGVSGYKYFLTFIIYSKTPVVIHTFGEEENSLLALAMDFQVYTILNAAKELHTINFQPNTISVPRPTCIRLKIPSVELTVL